MESRKDSIGHTVVRRDSISYIKWLDNNIALHHPNHFSLYVIEMQQKY